ncbi:hypothetical protein CHT98_17635 (plasmid) [Azospirillum brasilense]|uniref:Uncharacterized protein n=1 Tax=Azospirillum brasilense TaxID=192 RepID=A0A235HBS2_AZOBR|nr:hypothetical protein CHT98_17635 [Azospirillum brasilense]
MRRRPAQVEERQRLAAEAAEAARKPTVMTGRLDEFRAGVRPRRDGIDWQSLEQKQPPITVSKRALTNPEFVPRA